MAINATIVGRIEYATDAAFDAAAEAVRPWLDAQGRFVDEGDDVVPPGVGLDRAARRITIPFAIYRNLIRLVAADTPLFVDGVGRLIWTCTDGLSSAGVFAVTADGVIDEEVDLDAWGAATLPDPMPDPTDAPDEYADWQAEVEAAWLDIKRGDEPFE